MKMNKFILLLMIILTMSWGLSSASWFSMWMALEMNNMMIIPLLMLNLSQQQVEVSIKYFLIQSISSMMFIMMSLLLITPLYYVGGMINNMIMLISMMMKIGMFPFMWWYSEILGKSTFFSMKLIMTMQKILPMNIIGLLIYKNFMIMLFIMINAILGSVIALNQTNLKKILAFSSVSHMSWMILSMMINYSMFVIYLFIYSLILFSIINLLKKTSMSLLIQLLVKKNLMLSLNFLSLAGLPPFSGFIMKWMIIEMMMKSGMVMLSLIMIISSVISLYFYLRMVILSFMISMMKMKWVFLMENVEKDFFEIKSMINLMLVPILLFLYSFF